MLPRALAVLFAVPALLRAQPICEQTNLFEAGIGGYATYRIPGIIATPKGSLLVVGEARKHLQSDWGHIDIVLRRSTDGGSDLGRAAQSNRP